MNLDDHLNQSGRVPGSAAIWERRNDRSCCRAVLSGPSKGRSAALMLSAGGPALSGPGPRQVSLIIGPEGGSDGAKSWIVARRGAGAGWVWALRS